MADSDAQGMRVFVGDLPDPNDPTKVISLDPLTAFFTAKDPWGLGRLCTYTNR